VTAFAIGGFLLLKALSPAANTSAGREWIIGIDPKELETMTTNALDVAASKTQNGDDHTKESAIRLMRAMAKRSEDLWIKELGSRRWWERVNWSLGGIGAFFAAASGGGVLSGLTGAWRYILGFLTLFGAALGAVAATLQTVRHAQLASLKAKRYEAFARETWHDLLTVLPGMKPKDAVAELQARSRELDEIEQLGLPPMEERQSREGPSRSTGRNGSKQNKRDRAGQAANE
jgi:hypothetical protein